MRREALFMILGEKPKAEIVAEGGGGANPNPTKPSPGTRP
jgi:hypothetical protein